MKRHPLTLLSLLAALVAGVVVVGAYVAVFGPCDATPLYAQPVPRLPDFPTLARNPVIDVRSKGAKGDGTTVDTAAINSAINSANAAGGGTVLFTRGDYVIKPSAQAVSLKSNVDLVFLNGATLKVAGDTGTFNAAITTALGHTRVQNAKIRGMHFDWNRAGNTTVDVRTTGANSCSAVMLGHFDDVTIEDCTFDYSGVWAISLYTSGATQATSTNATIRNNKFNFTRQSNTQLKTQPDYDNTAVYLDCFGQKVTGNVGNSAIAEGARGFIETHNGCSVVSNNVCDGYKTVVSVVTASQAGDVRTNSDITVTGNTATRSLYGIQWWSITGYVLRNVTISGNTLGINNADWNAAACSGMRAARADVGGGLEGAYEGLTITNNTLTFQSEGAGRNTWSNPLDLSGGSVESANQVGIAVDPYGDVTGLKIEGNTIVRAPAIGITVGQDSYRLPNGNVTTGARVTNNVLIDPGQNKSNPNGYRIGIRLAASNYGTVCQNNSVISTDPAGLTGFYGVLTNVLGGTSVTVRQNDYTARSGSYVNSFTGTVDQSFTIGDLSTGSSQGVTGNSLGGNALLGFTRTGIGAQALQQSGSNILAGFHTAYVRRSISGSATVDAAADVMRIQDESVTSGANNGKLLSVGTVTSGTFSPKFNVAMSGIANLTSVAEFGVNNAGVIASSATLAVTSGNQVIATIRCQPAAAVTGIILAAGSAHGERVAVFNESAAASTITFAASGTSNVSDGTSDVIAGLTSREFRWNASTSLWYPVK